MASRPGNPGFTGTSLGRGRNWRARVGLPLVALVGFILISSAGYWLIEPAYSFADGLYMTVITVTTTGFREVHPLGRGGQAWTMFVVAGGLVLGGVVLTSIGSMIIEGQVRRILGRRQLERKIETLSGHVIICGYGRMGELIAEELKRAGRDVVVVDSDPDRTAEAESDGLVYVLGDAEEEEILTQAGIARASTLIAALRNDANNVFVTLTARELNTKLRIVARAQLPTTQDKLIKAGATRVVCPQEIGATRVADVVLRPALVDFVEMAHQGVDLEMDQLEIQEGSGLVGQTLADLALPRRIGATVVAVRRADGETVYRVKPRLTLQAGDVLILVGQRGAADAAAKIGLEAPEDHEDAGRETLWDPDDKPAGSK